jgi:hypothetical protein
MMPRGVAQHLILIKRSSPEAPDGDPLTPGSLFTCLVQPAAGTMTAVGHLEDQAIDVIELGKKALDHRPRVGFRACGTGRQTVCGGQGFRLQSISCLRRERFRRALTSLGGYRIDQPRHDVGPSFKKALK